MEDTLERFARSVANYSRYRPGYPQEVLQVLHDECGLTPASRIADIGSGTGLLTELFLNNGNLVFAVEPHPDMRAEAERRLHAHASFRSIEGSAEATTLAAASVDFVAVGQAFQFFDAERARAEFLRILAPGGWVALLSNGVRRQGSPFAVDFDAFWRRHVQPEKEASGKKRGEAQAHFFGAARIMEKRLDNRQRFDREGLTGRVLSSGDAPAAGDPRHRAMLDELAALFERHQQGGSVTLEYDTRMACARLSP